MSASNVLSVKDLSVTLGARRVVDSVSFAASSASMTWLVGSSGAGKTTLLEAIAGLDRVGARIEGTVEYPEHTAAAGTRAGRKQLAHLRRNGVIGWAPQNAADTFPPHLRLDTWVDPQDISPQFGIAPEWLRRRPGQLSGGQMARVSLATAMARKPAVLLADEPTAGLEPELALVVMRLLQAVAAQGAAVVATTHDLQALATLTNSAPQTGAAGQQPLLPGGSATILLRQGKMVEATPTEQFCAGRAHTPYGQAFVMASPMHGANPLPPEFDDDLTVTSDTPINTGWSVPAGGQGEKTRS